MTSTLLCDKMDTESEYQFQCSRAGTVSAEAYPKSESGSLDGFREDRGRLRMRKPGYLLNLGFRRGLQVRAVRRLLAQKYGCGSFCGCRSLFAFPVL